MIESLTPRELEVLALVARGLSNQEIAGKLGIKERTVRTHTTLVFGKLGVTNRTAATLKYLESIEAASHMETIRLKKHLSDLRAEFAYLQMVFDKFAAHMSEVK